MSFLFVALDSTDVQQVYDWVDQLDEVEASRFGYKINLDLITKYGLRAISDLPSNRPIFADMKMWNGVRTMTEACSALDDAGATFTSVHCLAGVDALKQLKQNLRDRNKPINLFGVTVMTHYDAAYCRVEFHRSLGHQVHRLAGFAAAAGLDGAIVPGTVLGDVFAEISTVVPAVRPKGYEEKRADQPQAVSLETAVQGGAGWVVCGSPITGAKDPQDVLANMLNDIRRSKQ